MDIIKLMPKNRNEEPSTLSNYLLSGHRLIATLSLRARRFTRFNEVEVYTGGGIATGRASHAGVKSQTKYVPQRPGLCDPTSLPIILSPLLTSIITN